MNKKVLLTFITTLLFLSSPSTQAIENKNHIIKNKFFSITMPSELNGVYLKKIHKDKIEIFDKDAKKSGFGGFAFGIKVFRNPADHATLPGSKKIGELTDKNGILYDVVIKYPTDVQFDYTKNPNAPVSYKKLYDLGETVEIQGIKNTKYYKAQGTKGENLYKDILTKHVTSIKENWDSQKLEKENMSYMYSILNQGGINIWEKFGYTYYDINADGIDELLIGEISQGAWKGIIYDIYTMVNRQPKHVISGGERNRYFVCDDVFLCNEYSSGALESGVITYILLENSTELYPQVSFKYDGYSNSKQPWFISYGNEINQDKWENVDEKTFKERKEVFEKYNRLEYKPFLNLLK